VASNLKIGLKALVTDRQLLVQFQLPVRHRSGKRWARAVRSVDL